MHIKDSRDTDSLQGGKIIINKQNGRFPTSLKLFISDEDLWKIKLLSFIILVKGLMALGDNHGTLG